MFAACSDARKQIHKASELKSLAIANAINDLLKVGLLMHLSDSLSDEVYKFAEKVVEKQ